jgi:hypothetical protein
MRLIIPSRAAKDAVRENVGPSYAYDNGKHVPAAERSQQLAIEIQQWKWRVAVVP